MTSKTRIIILFILIIAYGLRLYQLDFQSFWSDEGISLLRSAAPLRQLLAEMPVEHMPGYFVLLHFWMDIVGDHDFAVRYLSAWPSALAVALIFRLAIEMGQKAADAKRIDKTLMLEPQAASSDQFLCITSITSAALLATAPFQIWYAQEARMYTWLLAAGLVSHLCFWQLINRDPARASVPLRLLAGYVLSTALSVYLHFYGFLVPITHAIFAVGWAITLRRWRSLLPWVGAGLLIGLLFLPWLPRALQIFSFSGWREPGDPWQIPWRYLAAYTVGDPMPLPWRDQLTWLYLGLSTLGLIGWGRQAKAAAFFLFSTLFIPLSVVLLLAINNPDFHERYAIILSPMLALAVSGGIALIGSLFGRRQSDKSSTANVRYASFATLPALLLLGILLWGNGVALGRQYSETSLHKPDFRGAAWRIAHNERPGDVILVDGPDPEKVFLHYYRDAYQGQAPVFDLRALEGQSWEAISQQLAAMTEGAGRVWEVLYFHGPGPVQTWTAITGWATAASNHNDIRVTLYGMKDDPTTDPATNQSMDLPFGPGLTLLRTEINGDQFHLGDIIRVTTVWDVSAQLPDYKFSLRLLQSGGIISLARDYVPQNWVAPTTVWFIGSQATDQHGILLPPDLPPGRYDLTLRLYETASGNPVLFGGTGSESPDLLLRQIEVEAE